MLPNLEIRNFRTLEHLRIERFGRVNLIVGKNGVGKTTLLEALQIYGSTWPASTASDLLKYRQEFLRRAGSKALLYDLESLFSGRGADEKATAAIGPLDPDEHQPRLTMSVIIKNDFTEEALVGAEETSGLSPERSSMSPQPAIEFAFRPSGAGPSILFPSGRLRYGIVGSRLGRLMPRDVRPALLRVSDSAAMLEDTAERWDAIALTEAETQVLGVFGRFADVGGVTFIADPRAKQKRVAMARTAGMDRPMPLAALGDGAIHLFQIAVAMQSARLETIAPDDLQFVPNVFRVLLIDEIDFGIHYAFHADLWRFIFKTARELNVQVFATTHSWDCVQGFQVAAAEDTESEGILVRLEAGKGKIRSFTFGESELAIVTSEQIEVR